jgi:SUKH-4 immunity protein
LYLSGLPYSCIPFIGFGKFKEPKLEKLVNVYDLDDSFESLYVIGKDGSGDPICVEEITGKIFVLNHDNGFEEMFMNNSLHQLAEFILLVREGCSAITEKYGVDAAWNEGEAMDLKNIYREKLRTIDPEAIEDGFWSLQLT